MYRSTKLAGLVLMPGLMLLAQISCAQTGQPDSEPWSPAGETAPEEKSGWLFKSPLMNVGWPEVKMPKVEMPAMIRDKETGEPGMLAAPFVKMQSATRQAATKTRDAWNGTIDRMRMRLPSSDEKETPVATNNPPKQRFWSQWFGEEKAADRTDDPAELLAREPSTAKR